MEASLRSSALLFLTDVISFIAVIGFCFVVVDYAGAL
jgi:hypothetical protein